MRSKVMLLGCGFLSSHLLTHLIPHVEQFILVDREKIESVNYDNYILPKHQANKRKVTAMTSLLQMLAECRTTPVHMNIQDEMEIVDLISEHGPDLIIVAFDNIQARLLAKKAASRTSVPAIHLGVTENYIYVDWNDWVMLPDSEERIEAAEKEMASIRDVCTRLEFRGLGALAAGAAYHSIVNWINDNNKRLAFMIPIDEDGTITITTLKR